MTDRPTAGSTPRPDAGSGAGPRPRQRPIHIPVGAPPAGMPPSPEILVAMGEQGVFSMLEDVYALLEASSIRALFPDDMRASSRKSGAFFVQLLGGPALYSQRYGKPQMRQRHEPFEIDDEARAVWLACFDRVLSQAERSYGFPAEHLDGFRDFLASFSAWMLNAK